MIWRIWIIVVAGYWFMFTVGLLLGMFDFKWEITLGDIVLGVIAAIVTFGLWLFRAIIPLLTGSF